MSSSTPSRCRPRRTSGADLLPDVVDHDPSDRILRAEGCALLGVREDTFRDQYLTPERRAASIRRFGIERDERGRITVSRRLVLEHLVAVTREPWGGAYGPPGVWAERVRQVSEAAAAYAALLDALPAGESSPPCDQPTDPQRDLFAP